jgi:hypothetical protein
MQSIAPNASSRCSLREHSNGMETRANPRLLFFQYRYDPKLPAFLLHHKEDHVKCLAQFFDVTVIDHDCDYGAVCERHRPALALFESGLDNLTCRKPRITNLQAHPDIPKAGLHNADAFSGARAGFLSDMEHWGVETFFAISTTAVEHTPAIASQTFVWPNFVDTATYRDYGEWKCIPVLLTGNRSHFYPWRQRVFPLLSRHFPTLQSPHPGYGRRASSSISFLYGEQYARTISASMIAPACGTVAREVVRKHFEIPACRTCLVAEGSPNLEAAGFVDMENCVFADEHDAVEKVAFLLDNPSELARIADAGHALVRARHTLKQRNQIRVWFDLQKLRTATQRIVQPNPFEPPMLVPASIWRGNDAVGGNGAHLRALRQADDQRRLRRYEAAARLYATCLNYIQWLPEARLGLAACALGKGDARGALDWLRPSVSYVLDEYGAADPDPVEWAYVVICYLCLGKHREALSRAAMFTSLRHPVLERARWAAHALTGNSYPFPASTGDQHRRATLHPSFEQERDEWFASVGDMLMACGQKAAADKLDRTVRQSSAKARTIHVGTVEQREGRRKLTNETYICLRSLLHQGAWRGQRSIDAVRAARRPIIHVLHRAEARFGYFLPYRMSKMRDDEFYATLRQLTREGETFRNVLLIGVAAGTGCTEAFVAGVRENKRAPNAFAIALHGARGPCAQTLLPRATRRLPRSWHVHDATDDASLRRTLQTVKLENGIDRFDLVVVDGSALHPAADFEGLDACVSGARLVLLDDINHYCTFRLHRRFLCDPSYEALANNPGLRNGYAIYRLRDDARGADPEIALGRGAVPTRRRHPGDALPMIPQSPLE